MALIPQSVKRKNLIPSFTEPASLAFRQVTILHNNIVDSFTYEQESKAKRTHTFNGQNA